MRNLLCLVLAAIAILVSVIVVQGQPAEPYEPVEPYEQTFFITNSPPERFIEQPHVFREGTWVQFDTDPQGNLLICVAGHMMGDCIFTHEPPGSIYNVFLTPNCQGDGTIAFTYEVQRDPEPNIPIYFVDGYATFDRDEAEAWANETPGCTFDTIDEEW